MPKRISEKRVEAFFKALSETGNQTLAAERARVSRDWVRRRGKQDPAFRERVVATVEEAEAQLLAAVEAAPPEGWGASADGEVLAIRGCGRRRALIARVRLDHWSPTMEASFLTALASTCNVTRSAEAIGVTTEGAYQRRRRWPAFRERWDEALVIGHIRLDFALIENATNMLEQVEPDYDAPIPPMTFDQALQYLALHNRTVNKLPGRSPGVRRKPVDVEALKAEILRKIAVIDAANAMGDPDAAVKRMLGR